MKLLNEAISNLVQAKAFSRSFLTVIFATAALSLAVSCGKKDEETAKGDDKGKAKAEKECEVGEDGKAKDGYKIETDAEGMHKCVEDTDTPDTAAATPVEFKLDNTKYADVDFAEAGKTLTMTVSYKKDKTTNDKTEEIGEITAKTVSNTTTMSISQAAVTKLVTAVKDLTKDSVFKIMLKVKSGSDTDTVTLEKSAAYTFLMYIDSTKTEFAKPFDTSTVKKDDGELAKALAKKFKNATATNGGQ